MSIQLIGSAVGAVADVDASWRALRVTQRPLAVRGAYSLRMTGATTNSSATGLKASIRWASHDALMIVTSMTLRSYFDDSGFGGASVVMGAEVSVARGFSASDTGGTSALADIIAGGNSIRGNSPSLLGLAGGDARYVASGDTLLTAGTRTLDSRPLFDVLNAGSTPRAGVMGAEYRYLGECGGHPLVLEVNEGLVLTNTGSATPQSRWLWHISWLEAEAY